MLAEGVPPDQVEARLNEYVANAERWMADGGPHYVPPEPAKQPPPGFAEGFADTWFKAEEGVKDLIGQGGPGAPGVLESWDNMLKGPTEVLQNPLGLAVGEVQDALHSPSPAYYFGEKAADGAIAAPGLMFGGEGLGLGEVADVDVYGGMTHLPNSPVGLGADPIYHPWAESAAQDLYSSFMQGEPTAGLSQHLADMSTHYIGGNPDRVVLGQYGGQTGGYIGEARSHGGIYFDTGDPTWDALTGGLEKPAEQQLVWPVNEQFLRTQMENHVGRIEYILDRDKYSSLEDMTFERSGSYSAMEVEFLDENAAEYGYERVGDAWVCKGGDN
jgi:hypothetical protein